MQNIKIEWMKMNVIYTHNSNEFYHLMNKFREVEVI